MATLPTHLERILIQTRADLAIRMAHTPRATLERAAARHTPRAGDQLIAAIKNYGGDVTAPAAPTPPT